MNLIILVMLILGTILVCISWLKSELRCPPPQVVYRYIPKHTLDVQFGQENNPSEIFSKMFNDFSPWIGGYQLGNGKTYIAKKPKVV